MEVSGHARQLQYRILATRAGYVGLVASPRGLRYLYLPQRSQRQLRRAVRADFPAVRESRTLLPALARDLRQYFDGRRVEFDVPLDCAEARELEVAIWHAAAHVPYGKTVSYGELARRAGYPGAARAAGTAMKHNRFPIVVPCHRVIKSDGSLGGYSGPLGVAFKRRLLKMEAAVVGR